MLRIFFPPILALENSPFLSEDLAYFQCRIRRSNGPKKKHSPVREKRQQACQCAAEWGEFFLVKAGNRRNLNWYLASTIGRRAPACKKTHKRYGQEFFRY